ATPTCRARAVPWWTAARWGPATCSWASWASRPTAGRSRRTPPRPAPGARGGARAARPGSAGRDPGAGRPKRSKPRRGLSPPGAGGRGLACPVIGVTGSTGKTSTKDILKALLAPHLKTHANRENWNTEIGLPLTLLEAEEGTRAIVLEMAMRGEGQIDELVQI